MPYKSQAQRGFMHVHHPEIAKRWDKEYPNQGKLPQHVKGSKGGKMKRALKIESTIKKQHGI